MQSGNRRYFVTTSIPTELQRYERLPRDADGLSRRKRWRTTSTTRYRVSGSQCYSPVAGSKSDPFYRCCHKKTELRWRVVRPS